MLCTEADERNADCDSCVFAQMRISDGGLRIENHEEFVTARANASVQRGMWMYEVTLHTSGIMQVRSSIKRVTKI